MICSECFCAVVRTKARFKYIKNSIQIQESAELIKKHFLFNLGYKTKSWDCLYSEKALWAGF